MADPIDLRGVRRDVISPFGRSLSLRYTLSRFNTAVDAGTLTLEAKIYTDSSEDADVVDTLQVGEADGDVTIAGGDNLPVGKYWWSLTDVGADLDVIYGGLSVTERPTA